jgi:hypothetical protein
MTKQFEEIKIGDQVMQPRYKNGVVVQKEVKGKHSHVRVRFEEVKGGWYEKKYTLSQIPQLNFI